MSVSCTVTYLGVACGPFHGAWGDVAGVEGFVLQPPLQRQSLLHGVRRQGAGFADGLGEVFYPGGEVARLVVFLLGEELDGQVGLAVDTGAEHIHVQLGELGEAEELLVDAQEWVGIACMFFGS